MKSFNLPVSGRLDFHWSEERKMYTFTSYDGSKKQVLVYENEMETILNFLALQKKEEEENNA